MNIYEVEMKRKTTRFGMSKTISFSLLVAANNGNTARKIAKETASGLYWNSQTVFSTGKANCIINNR